MPAFRRPLPLLAAALLTVVALLAALNRVQAAQRNTSASYSHGRLSFVIPYEAPSTGAGSLSLELLDPEDHVLAHASFNVPVREGKGVWRESLTPDKPMLLEDAVWHRVRYRFVYDDHRSADINGIESVASILRRPVLRILGQSEFLSGSTASIRLIALSAGPQQDQDQPLSGAVQISLIAHEKTAVLFNGKLNPHGTLEAQLHLPSGLTGPAELRFTADTPIGPADYTQPITLEDKASILLTTEKPVYQPGQDIHIRALALDRATRRAVENRPLTFELEDARGNKVFRNATTTDSFGIASAEFQLADEVNLGAWHLRALVGQADQPTSTAEITLNVDRYVLPKFKVAVEFRKSNGKEKRDFRPGDHVVGTIHANYFFGKPVDRSEVIVKATSADVEMTEAAKTTGTTDAQGDFHFDLRLPNFFAGRASAQGAARVLIQATVKDAASHTETRGEPITVSKDPLIITAIPEGGTLIPHLDNQLYLLASYPDGTPAANTTISADLTELHLLNPADAQATTDANGIAVIHFQPNSRMPAIKVTANDHKGAQATASISLDSRSGADQVLLRSNRAVVKAGDRIALRVLSTRQRGTAYVDLVHNGQTILTRDVELSNGAADLSLIATPEMAGTLDLTAYIFGRDAQPVADHRLLFVQPADDLHIAATTDAATYKPGGEARIRFHVTNGHGEGVSAALGLQVVDEAVFALAEKQPGFAKVFFLLEQEVMQPRYEIHSLSMNSIVEPAASDDAVHERAAQALFSATEIASPLKVDVSFGREVPQQKFGEYWQRYYTLYLGQVQKVADRIPPAPSPARNPKLADALAAEIARSNAVDSWGRRFKVEPVRWGRVGEYALVRSAGPDHQFNTGDDLISYVRATAVSSAHPATGAVGAFRVNINHDHGPFNGRAEASGEVVDSSGASIPGATIQLRPDDGPTRNVQTSGDGSFTLSGLAPGHYLVSISSPGFQELSGSLNLAARDQAICSITLSVGAAAEAIQVTAESPIAFKNRGGVMGRMAIPSPAVPAPMMAAGAAVGVEVMDASIQTLPLNGRAASYMLLAPGVAKAEPETHVRSWFPEALYINPEILTDGHGNAEISVPIADSITTWRMAMLASTRSGAIATGTGSIKVFQDFFADLDLPVTLTQGDRVSLPVAIYNYTGHRDDVQLQLEPADWYALSGDSSDKSVPVDSDHVGGASYTLTANRIGKFKLKLTARMSGRADVVVREIEVVPNGKEQSIVANGYLEGGNALHQAIAFPAETIPDSTTLFVRLYPGPLSQIIEGMDSILRMPGGCFEQTSSSTYPNILALDYMKRAKKLTPETHAKAEGYIANGYQRLLTFEVPGGGFSWFGQAPANKILTSYGLMEFFDMSKVHDVDPRILQRTGAWLASQQQPDGSWKPDTQFINEGATDRFNTDSLRVTAYIAWALANTGYQGSATEKAKRYIESHSSSRPDAYTLAVIANFAVDYKRDPDFTQHAIQQLLDAAQHKDDLIFWTAEETGYFSRGDSASVETTGLAVQALLKANASGETVRKAIRFLLSKKQSSGNWGSTQATIMALRALVTATEHGSSDVRGAVKVLLNGNPVETLQLTADNNDLYHQFAIKSSQLSSTNNVELRFEGSGSLAYQVAGRYFVPWEEKPATDALSINVAYDRTTLAGNDIATATATVRSNLDKTANMVMVDLGIPPGFDLLSEDLDDLREKTAHDRTGRLEKFSQTATQAILYFNSLAPHQTVKVTFRLRAKYPIRAKTFQSRVYEYYDPTISATAKPQQLEVHKR